MEVNICVPTLRRYDLLDELITSMRRSELLPTGFWLIDNGGKYFNGDQLDFIDACGIEHHYRKFGNNLGLAASWNWFLQNVPEMRVICNDDVGFYPDTLGLLLDTHDPNAVTFPAGMPSTNSFSCFSFPDHIRDVVGLFDESISPGWAWFEDNDMYRRMCLQGFELRGVADCRIDHYGSGTLSALSESEKESHHEKFRKARDRYLAKWGGLPHQEVYTSPYNGAAL